MFSLFSGLFGNPPPHSLRLLEFPYLNLNDKSECSEFEFLHQNEKSECSEFVFLDQNEKSECSEFELTFSEYSPLGLEEGSVAATRKFGYRLLTLRSQGFSRSLS